MNKNIITVYAKIVFRLSKASIRCFEIHLNTDVDFEYIIAINLCIEGHA